MKRYLILNLILLIVGFCQAQSGKGKGVMTYADSILEERKAKNTEFMNDKDSPLTDEDKFTFLGLHYFPPDPHYRVTATLTRYDNPFHFKMKTTTDRLPEYAIYGKIEFKIRGKKQHLNVYQNIDLMKKPGFGKYLFIPFTDLTNGNETYHGGRFLDTEIPDGDILIIDFNEAYNPYCAYNSKYSCPIPPDENALTIEIKAGEKSWHK